MSTKQLAAGDSIVVAADGWDAFRGVVVEVTERVDSRKRQVVVVRRTERRRLRRNGSYPKVGEAIEVAWSECIKDAEPTVTR